MQPPYLQLVGVADSLRAYFPAKPQKDSASLIQGFGLVDEEDAKYNDGRLGSGSALRLTGQKLH